ncbi:hypothetical protein RND71_003366 [Anisodus tanguticus]|uniref:Uncharacterized protein n=1 Tax=Anisodus tanguticus TaxID=243964 RepID=A0AAE1SVR5_9SOLA|nr:hypothetical protein RND71_003366 [Anisodus tanguticus]
MGFGIVRWANLRPARGNLCTPPLLFGISLTRAQIRLHRVMRNFPVTPSIQRRHKTLMIQHKSIKAQIRDTTGQERQIKFFNSVDIFLLDGKVSCNIVVDIHNETISHQNYSIDETMTDNAYVYLTLPE